MSDQKNAFTDQEALDYHREGRPGKIKITASKAMETQRDLSLAYSPGVAIPVLAIAEDPQAAYEYTAKGNLVAVISNGTAILGLGDLGPLASKPVMEGKAVLFKRFADIDSIDLEIDAIEIDDVINAIKHLGPSFGGINLEDIKSPDCFIIEQKLREIMNIPVFHDDQHGTAIITAAAFLNALHLTNRDIKKTKVVVNGAGAAAIACTELMKSMGLPHENILMCDREGIIYQGREDDMNQWKSAYAAKTKKRSLTEALDGADVFLGLSVGGAVSQDMVKNMAKNPIIFAMANPEPEIRPEAVLEVRDDAIMATGRSDYPNQVNNVLGFPYIFRGALDVRATTINEEMKVAAAQAIAELARADVPDEVAAAYGKRPKYGPDYIIPAPFDPRLIEYIPPAVAQAAMDSGVSQIDITDMDAYRHQLASRMNPTVATLGQMFEKLKRNPRRIIFAEAEDDRMIQAALNFRNGGYGTAILVGQEHIVEEKLKEAGITDMEGLEILSAKSGKFNDEFIDYVYARNKRKGLLRRDVRRMVNRDRNVFGACCVAMGYADGMVTGVSRHYWQALQNVMQVIDPHKGHRAFGMSVVVNNKQTVFIADTAINENPTGEEMADIAIQAADAVRRLGFKPRVAFLSFSNFGNPMRRSAKNSREAVQILDERGVNFEYEGEMAPDVALRPDLRRELYPFSRLTGPANILIMPDLHTANISYKLLAELGASRIIGPILWGLNKPVQICRMTATANDVLNMAGIAAMGSWGGLSDLEDQDMVDF